MNAVDVGGWNAWAWSLPLIVLNLVIHVLGLGLINESVVPILTGAVERRHFLLKFVVVMGIVAFLATLLHGFEAVIWAGAYRLLGGRRRSPVPNRFGRSGQIRVPDPDRTAASWAPGDVCAVEWTA